MSSRGADMDQQSQVYRLTWQGIAIEARYWPRKWGVTAHLEIESVLPERAPLPITDTGYRSHFHQPGTIEALGGDVVAQVIAWLDQEAVKPAWRSYVDASKQGECSDRARRSAPALADASNTTRVRSATLLPAGAHDNPATSRGCRKHPDCSGRESPAQPDWRLFRKTRNFFYTVPAQAKTMDIYDLISISSENAVLRSG